MSGVRPTPSPQAEKALVIGTIPLRAKVLARLHEQLVTPAQADNAYAAMAELCRHPSLYRAVVVSLQGLYREELQIIPSVKRAHRRIKVWVTDLEGRPAALAEAMRLGADGLLGEDGLHRLDADEGGDEIPPPEPRPAEDVWEDGAGPATPKPAVVARPEPATTSRPAYAPAFGDSVQRPGRAHGMPERSPERQPVRVADPREANRPAAVAVAAIQGSKPVGTAAEPAGLLGDVEGTRANGADEPVLSPDELRALLHDPSGDPF